MRWRLPPNPYEAPLGQETNFSSEWIFSCFRFPGLRNRQSVVCADVIAVCRYQPSVAVPYTYGGAVVTVVTMAESHGSGALRPRNRVVPLYHSM
jgi:hypothetical protein